eukprot:bmy_17325T0
MAQFAFEGDLHPLLQPATPIADATPARWQRKAKEASGRPPRLCGQPTDPTAPGGPRGRTPGKSSSKIQTTPSKPGGDRYIPRRSASQMEVASFLPSEENQPEDSQTPTKKEHRKHGLRSGTVLMWRKPRSFGSVEKHKMPQRVTRTD